MKNLTFAAVALVLSFSTTTFAKDKTVGSILCYVHANGSFNGQVVLGDEFFQKAAAFSNRNNTCVIAKIRGEEGSSRIYLNGRRPISRSGGLTNSEVKSVLSSIAISPSSCTVFSCEESAI